MGRRGLSLFVAMCVIWGMPYLFIKVAVRELSPATLVFSRTAISALLLLPLAGGRYLRPLVTRWRPVVLFAAIEIGLPWFLLSDAEQRLSSSLTALVIAAVPLVGALLTFTSPGAARLGRESTIGLLIGLVGVAALVGLDTGGASLTAIGEVGLVAVCYAIGPVILDRHLSRLPSLGVIAASLGLCALAYAPIAAFELPTRMPGGKVIASVLVLAILCTAVAFLLFFELIATIGPVPATVITYVNPAVAAILGVSVLGESLTVGMTVGFFLILVGSVLATRRPGASGAVPRAEAVSAGALAAADSGRLSD